jgi:hypothetical protein
MTVPISTPQVLERLGCFKDELRPFTTGTVPSCPIEKNSMTCMDVQWSSFVRDCQDHSMPSRCRRALVGVQGRLTILLPDQKWPRANAGFVLEAHGRIRLMRPSKAPSTRHSQQLLRLAILYFSKSTEDINLILGTTRARTLATAKLCYRSALRLQGGLIRTR